MSEPTLEEQGAAFKTYLLQRLFGLVAVVEKPGSEEYFPQASGVVIEIQGGFVLVTVAHFLRDALRWKKEGRLAQLSLVVHHESGLSRSISLDLTKIPPFPHDSHDVGFILLPTEIVSEIVKFGGKAVRKEQVGLPSDEISRYFFIGQAAAYSKMRTETIASDGKNMWVLNKLASTSVGITNLQFVGDGASPDTFRFVPQQGIMSS